ncbi:hypothetical protein GLYMA_14G136550v4 [Glycine max]|nr:hypothetical protein GLYMA_14G136550v4 [Glycine max]KAH1104939.1 hypothetical protein GYH30_038310 [Glycine max]
MFCSLYVLSSFIVKCQLETNAAYFMCMADVQIHNRNRTKLRRVRYINFFHMIRKTPKNSHVSVKFSIQWPTSYYAASCTL